MSALANVALTDTFDTWRIRTNQVIVKGNDEELKLTDAYDKANAANVLAFQTGIGANAFTSATIAGANTAVGAGANAFASATIAGANTAVGAGANAFTSATIAGANTAVGAGANAFTSATIAGANTTVGAGANAFTSATIAGANTTVGAGANAFTSSTIAGANTAVGAGANTISIAAFNKANNALANSTGTFSGNLTLTGSVNARSGIISTANNTVGSDGQALLSTGSGTYWGTVSASSTAPTTQIFTSSTTWTRPTGCKFIKVTVIGSGGGGGSGQSFTAYSGCWSATLNSVEIGRAHV